MSPQDSPEPNLHKSAKQLKGKKKEEEQQFNISELPQFLTKTYEFVNKPATDQIVCWNEEGNGFIVRDVTKFTDQILPDYFKHKNYASFIRQLNMYDFKKTRQIDNIPCFSNQNFVKGKRHLLANIKRKTTLAEKNQMLLKEKLRALENQNMQGRRIIKGKRKEQGPLMIT